MTHEHAFARVALKYGLVADVVTDATDRSVYVPPPVARDDHDPRCGCVQCVTARKAREKA